MLKKFLSLFLILFLLSGCGDDEDASDAAAAVEEVINPEQGDLAAGQVVFQNQCLRCHGTDGMGGGATQPVSRNITNADAARIQSFVRTGPGQMPTFTLSDISTEDLNNLIAYILNEWP